MLTVILGTQVGIGIKVIHNNVPLELGSLHQIGAVTVLTAFLFALHSCRKVDIRHIRNLFGKLKIENPDLYKKLLDQYKGGNNPEKLVKALNRYRR